MKRIVAYLIVFDKQEGSIAIMIKVRIELTIMWTQFIAIAAVLIEF